jgi:hypothetical protein
VKDKPKPGRKGRKGRPNKPGEPPASVPKPPPSERESVEPSSAPSSSQEPSSGPKDAPISRGASEGWNRPKPDHIPRPTAWPAGLALGVTFLLWGIVTSLVVVAIGLALFAVSLTGWIGEIRNEANQT